VFPVCKPAFVKGEHPLRSAADLARCTLLDSADDSYYERSDARQPGWPGWLHAAGVPDIVPKRYLSFTPRILMHRGVRAGLGIGLSRTLLAVDALASKELIVPFGPAVPQATTYSLVFPTYLAKRRDVAAFCAWVLAEARESSRKLDRALKKVASR
jgi:LysR family glycine cleavage system transcriptional activator